MTGGRKGGDDGRKEGRGMKEGSKEIKELGRRKGMTEGDDGRG